MFLVFFTSCFIGYAQSVAINTDGSNPDGSAILDIKSSSKGILLPRLTKAQRDAVLNPSNGLLIYQTDNSPGIYTFQSASGWTLSADNLGNHTASQNLNLNGFKLFNQNAKGSLSLSPYGDLSLMTHTTFGGISEINEEKFKIDSNGGFYIRSTLGVGAIPIQGNGDRLLWHPYKAAFRAGTAANGSWDDVNVGFYSWAGGSGSKASSVFSFSYGDNTVASAVAAVSMGSGNVVSGAAGFSAGGLNTVAGAFGIAIGTHARAIGKSSVALGEFVSATNDHSIALGFKATSNGYSGTMIMGDNSATDSVKNSASNQFAARYAGGYKFFTNSTATFGAQLTPGASSWSTISDSTKKEGFVKADAEAFLKKLRQLKLGSWNYKTQDPNQYRHYGPMAQEIFAAYGKDRLGTIGSDTLLASADMDGIMMILLQGLEKRSEDQKLENDVLKKDLAQTKTDLLKIKEENGELKTKLVNIEKVQTEIYSMYKKLSSATNTLAVH